MSKIATAITAGFLLVAIRADAEIYHWTDESGVSRYTNEVASVPAEARGRLDRFDPQHRGIQRAAATSLRSTLQRQRPGRLVEVPFERDGELLRVEVRINDALVVPFHLDTATAGISIPESVASAVIAERAATLERTSTGPRVGQRGPDGVVDLDSFDLGGARVRNIEGTVDPDLGVGRLGSSFLNQFNYFVDTAGGVILFERVGPIDEGASSARP